MSVKTFNIALYLGGRRVGSVSYTLADCAVFGEVSFITSDRELRHALIPLVSKRRTWSVLLRKLKNATQGLCVLRFSCTPASDGRGSDTTLQRCFSRTGRSKLKIRS